MYKYYYSIWSPSAMTSKMRSVLLLCRSVNSCFIVWHWPLCSAWMSYVRVNRKLCELYGWPRSSKFMTCQRYQICETVVKAGLRYSEEMSNLIQVNWRIWLSGSQNLFVWTVARLENHAMSCLFHNLFIWKWVCNVFKIKTGINTCHWFEWIQWLRLCKCLFAGHIMLL